MPQVMLIRVITYRAQIIIITFRALPSNPINRLLSTRITHRAIMLDSRRSAVQDTKEKVGNEI